MRPAVILGVLGLGCAARGELGASATDPIFERGRVEPDMPAAEPSQPKRLAARLAQAKQLLAHAEISHSWISSDDAARAKAQGLDAELLGDALRGCVLDTPRCAQAELGEQLVRLAGELGTPAHVPALLRLARYILMADRSIEEVLARRMGATLRPCAPPDGAAVAVIRDTLDDLVVIDRIGTRRVARLPDAQELDDAAYFLAAVQDNGAMIGADPRVTSSGGTPTQSAVEDRAELRDRLQAALLQGDVDEAQRTGVAYLGSLGYPGTIDASLEADQTWGGARFSNVMREVAFVSEIAGEPGVAADLYRRANPGGGACGTSVEYRRGKQLRGLIRVAERMGACKTVIAERLLDWEHEYDPPGTGNKWRARDAAASYGPGRLVDAGFDLVRLYRGALVFKNREGGETELGQLLARAPSAWGPAALARLRSRGAEAWEHRVRAIEGLADVVQRDAIAQLVAQLPAADAPLRVRTLAALGQLGRRWTTGPCEGILFGGSIGGSWNREVTPLADTSCESQLDGRTVARLATQLRPWQDDGDVQVRTAAIEALGELAATTAVPRLERRRRALQRATAACKPEDGHDDDDRCRDGRQEAEAITDALESIRSATTRG